MITEVFGYMTETFGYYNAIFYSGLTRCRILKLTGVVKFPDSS